MSVQPTSGQVLVHVTRGGTLESVHRGHLSILDGDGNTIAALGDPERVAFIRSSSKPLQVMPFIISGGADRFGFTEKEIALACGSHGGEPMHTQTAFSMLTKAGMTESDLRCGTHLPFNEAAAHALSEAHLEPTQLHNNCSGKHAAMLAYAKHLGLAVENYEDPRHPIQQAMLDLVADFSGVARGRIKLGIDGCAAPNFAMPVSAMARSFARLVCPPMIENPTLFDNEKSEAARRVITAMMTYPEMIGGSDRLDTLIMNALPGRIISKIGAEGVWLAGILPTPKWKRGLGIALKIEDGNDNRARAAAAITILRQLEILTAENDGTLAYLSPMDLKNRRGDVVGQVETVFNL